MIRFSPSENFLPTQPRDTISITEQRNACIYKYRAINWGILYNFFLIFFFLKVPSGQIRSAWEWFHWIGHEKDINHYTVGFFIFLFSTLNSEPQSSYLFGIFLFGRRLVCRIWRISTIRNPNQNSAAHWWVFSSNKSVPVNRKQSFYTSRLTKNKEIACIFVFQKFMIKI